MNDRKLLVLPANLTDTEVTGQLLNWLEAYEVGEHTGMKDYYDNLAVIYRCLYAEVFRQARQATAFCLSLEPVSEQQEQSIPTHCPELDRLGIADILNLMRDEHKVHPYLLMPEAIQPA